MADWLTSIGRLGLSLCCNEEKQPSPRIPEQREQPATHTEGFVPGQFPMPSPNEEAKRLQVLREMDILDTAAEKAFDNIADWGRRTYGVPICLVSLVDAV